MSSRPQELIVTDAVRIPFEEFEFQVSKSSGPGGQNVNKVNSRVQLRWRPGASTALPPEALARFLVLAGRRMTTDGEFILVGQQFRDAPRNREDCLNRLAELVRAALVKPRKRRATKPSRGSKERRLSEKKRRSSTKAHRRAPDREA